MTSKNLLTKKSDGIGWITINRPDKLNAMNIETIEELKAAFRDFENDPEVKAVILTGQEKRPSWRERISANLSA